MHILSPVDVELQHFHVTIDYHTMTVSYFICLYLLLDLSFCLSCVDLHCSVCSGIKDGAGAGDYFAMNWLATIPFEKVSIKLPDG